jgi:hypothetical protein
VADELFKQIQGKQSIKEAAQQKGLSVEETGFFSRTAGVIPKIGPAAEFMSALSSLTEKTPVPNEVFRTKEGNFVVKLSKVEAADVSKFPAVKADLERRLIFQKQDTYVTDWLGELRKKGKIDINKDVLKG